MWLASGSVGYLYKMKFYWNQYMSELWAVHTVPFFFFKETGKIKN